MYHYPFYSKRGVSEVIGALLIAGIVLTMSMTWITLEADRSTKQTASVVDMIRAAGKSQQQSLSLTYYYKQDNTLHLYLYNYGTENSTPQLALINQNIVYWQTLWTFKWYRVTSDSGDFGQPLGQTTHAGTSYTYTPTSLPFSNPLGYQADATFYFTNQTTTIDIQTADGMEVYLDNQPILNNAWYTQPLTPYTKTLTLQPGTHQITTKWYQWQNPAYSSFTATNTAPYNSLSMTNLDTQTPSDTIPPKTLIHLTLPAPDTQTLDLLITTTEGGFFTWKLYT